MKTHAWIGAAAFLVLALPAAAQEQVELGSKHKLLKQFVGTWDTKSKFMTGPDQPDTESEGRETVKLAKGGFWITFDYRGEMAGIKYTGHGTMTWDPKREKYIISWVDSMSSELTIFKGDCDESGKVFTMTGQIESEGNSIDLKLIYTMTEANKRKVTFNVPGPDGTDIEIGTIQYTRAEKTKKKKEKKKEE